MASSSSSSSFSSRTWRYNVFTSFHEPDVRIKFLSHLRKQFDDNGITMFDDNGIERSQIIAPALTKAIKESRIAIVLLSKNYASSSWCLDELLEILKCKEEIGQIVMTVFYEVDPSHVRKQTGDFEIAFNETCAGKTEEKKRKWSQALTYVGNIAGEDLKNWPNEAKMIEKIARDVSHKVNDTPCRDFDVMVGLDDHFRKMESLLDLDNVGVKIVGISGPAGIGYHIKKEEKLPSIFTSGNSPLKMALVQEPVTSLADIKGFKTTWRIQVKIIHSWKPYLPATRETIEMILSDNTGTMIHATVKKEEVPKFQRDIVAGQWRFFENFTLSKAVGKFRPTNHPLKMSLMNNTNIRESPMISNDMYFDFVSFEDIVDSNALNENILIDIIGQVVNVGEMETPTVANKPSKKLEVELRDTRDLRLVCTLWGRFADTMYDACQNGGNNMVVCILRFAKINSYLGEKRVSSAYDISVMTINPTYPEAVQFLDNLPKDGLGLTMKVSIPKQIKEQKKEEEFNSLPRTTITELTSSIFEGKFRLLCTIYGIDADWSWYYFCCLKCSKTVYKVPKVENQKVPKDRKPLFWCGTCRKTTSRVQPRYKLIVDVVDPTAQTKLLLFDSHAAKIVMSSSFDLLNGQLDEIEDPTILPQGLVNLKGKTFQFVVSVESDNIGDSNDTYKVGYVWLGIPNEQFDTITESESVTDLTPGVSVDGEALMLTHSTKADEGFGSETKTPSSKRKEESSEDQYDQYSSSKKLCVPSISGAFDRGDLGEGENKSG